MARNERPTRRVNPNGKVVWVCRWTDKTGQRRTGIKGVIPGTYAKQGPCRDEGTTCCAFHAIRECYRLDERGPTRADTLGAYAATWTSVHPRSRVTDRTNDGRLRNILHAPVGGVPLREWRFKDLRRRHAYELVAFMLVDQERALLGVRAILQTLSAMTEDAITDEVEGDALLGNPFKGVKVRANDPRIVKEGRKVRTWSWEQMHAFAASCAVVSDVGREDGRASREYRAAVGEPMARLLSDCGLRLGELLALRRRDWHPAEGVLEVRQSLTEFGVEPGTKGDKLRGVTDQAEMGRVVPVPPGLAAMLDVMPKRIDSELLFPAPLGGVWWMGQWRRDVWEPAQARSGLDARPHEFRHSQISLLRAAGVDPADLAAVSGHNLETATKVYTHAMGRSFEAIRKAVGE